MQTKDGKALSLNVNYKRMNDRRRHEFSYTKADTPILDGLH